MEVTASISLNERQDHLLRALRQGQPFVVHGQEPIGEDEPQIRPPPPKAPRGDLLPQAVPQPPGLSIQEEVSQPGLDGVTTGEEVQFR